MNSADCLLDCLSEAVPDMLLLSHSLFAWEVSHLKPSRIKQKARSNVRTTRKLICAQLFSPHGVVTINMPQSPGGCSWYGFWARRQR